VIGLAARLAVSGGRESVVRLVLTVVGVAIGTTMLLLAAAADPAIRAQQRHTAWQSTTGDQEAREGAGDPLLWWVSDDAVDGRELTLLQVAATGPDSPVPLGLGHVPRTGEVAVSPALAELLDELPADRLADRFPAAPSGTIGDAFLAGPDDLVAVVGTPADVLRRMDAPEVYRISTRPTAFDFNDFLRVALAMGAVGLLVPILVFVSTSTRIGAARREQRFAALRLAGATPRQTAVVAAVEAGAAAVVGVVSGAAGFALLRPWVAGIELDGHESFVADVRVAPPLLVLVLVAVPALAVVAAMASLRRLQVSPLGVARRAVRPRPTVRRLVPLAVGTAGFVASLAMVVRSAATGWLLAMMAGFALMIYGIVAAGPWFTLLTARVLAWRGAQPSVLLAGRRLEADPAGGFRAVSGLVLAVFVASVFSGVTPTLLADNETDGDGVVEGTSLAVGLPAGTSASAAVVALDAAAAAGGGRGVVFREDPEPDVVVFDGDDPGRAGAAAARGSTVVVACADIDGLGVGEPCPAGGTARIDTSSDTSRLEPADYTAAEIAGLPAQFLVIPTDGSPTTTDRVRTAVERALPGALPWLGAEADAAENRRLTQLNRLANIALGVTLAIAGCGLAVALAAGIIERKRPFALLRLTGMHLGELQRAALVEAAAPLLLIALASAVLGLATAAVVVTVTVNGGTAWRPPTLDYWLSLTAGLVVAMGVAAAALPLLGRTTAPSAVRFE
jgi:hypothetical protein